MKFEIEEIQVRAYERRSGEKYKNFPKIYIFPEGESILEGLYSRRQRPYKFFKQEILPLVIEDLSKNHKDVFDRIGGDKWGWRQDCGCSMCPCSPGFVGSSEYAPHNIYVTVRFSE